jgi:hypothetical protein
MTTSPTAAKTSPLTQTARAPNLDTNLGVMRAAGIIVAERGSTASAATSGL